MPLLQSTQFEIRKLTIQYNDGKNSIDIRGMYEELSVFDSMLMPCMSGNILLRDGVGLASKINFDGSETIEIDIVKDIDMDNSPENVHPQGQFMFFKRKFTIYKLTDRKVVNQNSEVYTLHFVSPEFILSEQKKVHNTYTDTHSNIIKKILTDHLKVPNSTPDMATIVPSKGIHSVPPSNRSPLDAINHLTKRALSFDGKPDFVFWQAPYGYNLLPLSLMLSYDPVYTINFGVKNLAEVSDGKDRYNDEILGARDYKVLSNFNYAQNIQSGVYASKFIGFDTLTRTIRVNEVSYDDVFTKRANQYPINTNVKNKENKLATQMYDSRVTLYPFQSDRTTNPYVKSNDVKSANIVDDTDNYILQRKMIFDNLMQKRIRVTMPGNFGLYSGSCVQLNIPHRYNIDTDTMEQGDKSLSGKYIIIGVRHLIRYDKHETILEVATDSTNYKT
jgi:hypothetical protein